MGKWGWIICSLILAVVVVKTWELKTMSYDKFPRVGVTFDEYAFAWMGKSLIASGMPVAWTTNLEEYQKKSFNGNLRGMALEVDEINPGWDNLARIHKPAVAVVTFDYGLGDRYIGLVQPYLDHPPLAGLVYAMGMPQKFDRLLDITPEDFRYANRYLAAVSAVLVFVLGGLWYSPVVGLVAAIFYSTVPAVVLSGRLTMAENVVIPLFLLSLVVLQLAETKKKVWMYAAAGLLAGLTILAKFSGAAAVIAGVGMIGFEKNKRKKLVIFGLTAAIAALIYPIYGLIISPETFWRVVLLQSNRGIWGMVNLWQGIERINFPGFILDGWWAGGALVLAYLAASAAHKKLVGAALALIIVTVALGGENFSWYVFPLGLVFCLGYGVLVHEAALRPGLANLSLLGLFPVASAWYWGYFQFHRQTNFSWPVKIGCGLLLAAGLVLPKLISKPWVRWTWWVFLAVLMQRMYVWNFRAVLNILLNWGEIGYPLAIP